MSEISIIKKQGLAWFNLSTGVIVLSDPMDFYTDLLAVILTHETVHSVIMREIGDEACRQLDNFFGNQFPSVLLMPGGFDVEYCCVYRRRAESLWTRYGGR